MNLLLDTAIFLWYIAGDARLSPVLRAAIRDPDNRVYLSVVSVWEMIVKQRIGRLPLPEPAWTWVAIMRDRHVIASLALEEPALAHLAKLPPVHRDPFDRMLVCQAIEHDLLLATSDAAVRQYPIRTIG